MILHLGEGVGDARVAVVMAPVAGAIAPMVSDEATGEDNVLGSFDSGF